MGDCTFQQTAPNYFAWDSVVPVVHNYFHEGVYCVRRLCCCNYPIDDALYELLLLSSLLQSIGLTFTLTSLALSLQIIHRSSVCDPSKNMGRSAHYQHINAQKLRKQLIIAVFD